jgi:16S rRNA (cytidine1402-2'-O)-methyltransferase
MSGTLYLIPVFLGEGSPWPAVLPATTRETACRLKYFVAENAKTTRAALKWLEHSMPIRDIAIEQLPEMPSPSDIERLLAPLLTNHDVGLMSEAGCPGVADPGALLVRRAHELELPVRPLIGPSSLLLALMASGLDGQRFAFHGYLPARDPARSKRIAELEKESRHKQQTQLFIETPYRNETLFDALLASCQPQTRLCLASDLSLPSETVATRSIKQWRTSSKPVLDRRPTVFLLLA